MSDERNDFMSREEGIALMASVHHRGWFARLRARIFRRSKSVVSGSNASVRVSETPRKEGDA